MLCSHYGVTILAKGVLSRNRKALPVIQYLQSLCRLSFELLQGTEALGENQDRGEALTSLGVLC